MKGTDLNLRHIEAIVGISRHGSISAASLAVNLSQPALTQALAGIERTLGHRLFDRHPGGAVPSEAGRVFLARCERALNLIVNGARALRRAAKMTPIPFIERRIVMGQLRALVAVERLGSYTLAARDIGLSQPSVHRAVKELEEALEMVLLFRAGPTMRATGPTERLVRAARLAFAELQAGLDDLVAMRLVGSGRVIVGALPLPRAGLLPETLVAFARMQPSATVQVVEAPYADLLASLRCGEIDILLGALRDPSPAPDVTQRILFRDGLTVVARVGHPLADIESPNLTDLSRYPWVIAPQGAPLRAKWEAMFDDVGMAPPSVRIECGSILVIRGLLLSDDWLTLLSPDQFRIEAEAGLLRTIGDPVSDSMRKIGVTTRVDWWPTTAQAAFMAQLDVAATKRSSGN